jgi:hypothetical protein
MLSRVLTSFSCHFFAFNNRRMMEFIILILCILAILVATYYRREHMTNKDLVSIMQTYGKKDDDDSKKKKDSKPQEAPIMGPKSGGMGPAPTTDPKSKTSNATAVYPEIYGPDAVMEPGKPADNGKHESDNVNDPVYSYNPDLQKAFPTEGEPQPFLNDFMPFQK